MSETARARARASLSSFDAAAAELEALRVDGLAPPQEYQRAFLHLAACARAVAAGAEPPAPPFARGSDAFWWHELIHSGKVTGYSDVYEGTAPLISLRPVNLSRTPREEAEVRGLVAWEEWSSAEEAVVAAPGAGVRLQGLQGTQSLNGRLGRVLPREGPGAPADAVAPGRVAVRLAGAAGQIVSVKPCALAPARVLAAPRRAAAPQPPPPWAPAAAVARAAAACAVFLDLPFPPDAPTAVVSVGLLRQPATMLLQGAQVGRGPGGARRASGGG
jgi:hypothetical protein